MPALTYSIELEAALRGHGLTVAVGPAWRISGTNGRTALYSPGACNLTIIEEHGEQRSVYIGGKSAVDVAGVIRGLLGARSEGVS